jgi:hypothetical protein
VVGRILRQAREHPGRPAPRRRSDATETSGPVVDRAHPAS